MYNYVYKKNIGFPSYYTNEWAFKPHNRDVRIRTETEKAVNQFDNHRPVRDSVDRVKGAVDYAVNPVVGSADYEVGSEVGPAKVVYVRDED